MSHSTIKQPINCCVIGYGMAGKGFHCYLVTLCPDLHLHSILVRSPAKQQQAKHDYPHATIYTDVNDIANNPDISLVIIATPPVTHTTLAHTLLSAGKHIVIDKPVGLSLHDIHTIQSANKHHKHIFPFHQRRFDSDYLTVLKLMSSHQLGKVKWIEMSYNKGISTKQWKLEPTKDGGGRLWDLAPHMIDQFVDMHSHLHVDSVYARILYDIPIASDVDSHAQVTVVMNDGTTGVFDVNSVVSTECKPRFYLVGDRGTFVKCGQCGQEAAMMAGDIDSAVEPPESYGQLTWRKIPYDVPGVDKQTKTATEVIPTEKGQWKQFYQNVADVVNGKAQQKITFDSIKTTYAIMEAALRSAKLNEVVKFKDGKLPNS